MSETAIPEDIQRAIHQLNDDLYELSGADVLRTNAIEVFYRSSITQLTGRAEAAETSSNAAWQNRDHFCHWLNEIGKLFWGDDKQCYAPDAVFRMVEASVARVERLTEDNRDLMVSAVMLLQHARASKKSLESIRAECFDDSQWAKMIDEALKVTP